MDIVAPEQVGLSSARLARIGSLTQRFVDEGKFAGMVTLLARHGQVAHLGSVGYRDLAGGKPMTPDTIFRIYSMTKLVTSVAAMMLFERGEFLLGDPVANFIPAFAGASVLTRSGPAGLETIPVAQPITIRDLLTHTAGLSYGFFLDSPVEAMYKAIHDVTDFQRHPALYPADLPMAELVERWAAIPLLHQPGTAWRYSVGTDVLGRIIEVVSGQSLGDFFRREIFEPLGMVDTGFFAPPDRLDRLAALYTITDPASATGDLKAIDGVDDSLYARPRRLESGGGGLVSTAGDYLRFCQMLLNGGELGGARLLGRKTVALMTANHIPASQLPLRHGDQAFAGEGFGLGFGVIVDPAASLIPWSQGAYYWGGAANTTFWVDPRESLIGILMTQFMPSDTFSLNDQFRVAAYQALTA